MKIYDSIPHLVLKVLRRKIYPRLWTSKSLQKPECEQDIELANTWIYDSLVGESPCMIARLGASEMSVISNYIYIQKNDKNIWKYIQGENGEWWWNEHSIEQLKMWSGVWPNTHEVAKRFSKLSIEDCKQVDILGSWLPGEQLLNKELENARKVNLYTLEPFFAKSPWTKALRGKRVLLVHPFAESIEIQYKKRDKLFENPDVLPEFHLLTYKSVQSLGGNKNYNDWFDALDKMKGDIDRIEFDIAILGCGAYGLSLAAHIKRTGRKAVHLGGVTQLLFGIKGKRWESPVKEMCQYGYYPDLFNEYWVNPSSTEKPKSADVVENACYW